MRSWLSGLVTCDLVPRKVGEGAFGLCVGKTGKILAELYVVLLEQERFLVGLRRPVLAALLEYFERHLVMEDVRARGRLGRHGLVVLARRPGHDVRGRRDGSAAAWSRSTTGTGTCAVVAPAASAGAVRDAIVARGGDDLLVATEDDWHAFRIERGIAWFGHDFDEGSYPQGGRAGALFGVSFDKGCYLGQEAVFMLQVRGHVKKRLVQLSIEGDVEKGAPIALPDGTRVGAITSVAPPGEGPAHRARPS